MSRGNERDQAISFSFDLLLVAPLLPFLFCTSRSLSLLLSFYLLFLLTTSSPHQFLFLFSLSSPIKFMVVLASSSNNLAA